MAAMPRSRLIEYFALSVGVVAALAGCGGATAPGASAPTLTASVGRDAPAEPGKAVRQVKLEVLGKGASMQPIIYFLDGNGSEAGADLPWSKSARIELTGAEREVGRLVSVVGGSVRAANGQLRPAACRITVDGEEVTTGKGSCKHLLK